MNSNESRALTQLINQKQFLSADKSGSLLKELTSKESEHIINKHSDIFRNRIYTPLTTLYTFVKQVLAMDKSCKNAVTGVIVECLAEEKMVSPSTGAYSAARKRLSQEMIHELSQSVSDAASPSISKSWKPYGRDLKVIDGTTITLADTAANTERYPKHSNTKCGVGFPMIRLVLVLSLLTGCVINYAYDACKGKGTGEISLLMRILACISDGDIVLADRYYCHFFLFHDLQKRQVDILVPGHAQRHYNFRCKKKTMSSRGKNREGRNG